MKLFKVAPSLHFGLNGVPGANVNKGSSIVREHVRTIKESADLDATEAVTNRNFAEILADMDLKDLRGPWAEVIGTKDLRGL